MSPRAPRPAVIRPKIAYEALAADPSFGPWVRAIGRPRFPRVQVPAYAYLARCIVYQQLAGQAAATIHGRFIDAVGGSVTPAAVGAVDDDRLRAAGLSRGKLAAVRDLTEKASALDLDALVRLPDEEVERRLVTVRGIGPWTAHMFLIFALRRADVWPVGDFGVRMGYARIHGLAEPLAARDMVPRGEAVRPWRSVAAWYCWRALEIDPPGGES